MTEENGSKRATELRVLITEDGKGNLDVEWESVLKSDKTPIQMRPSHVAGQLFSAAHIVLAKSYEGYRGSLESALAQPPKLLVGNSPKEDKKKKHRA
jgi:hypothetical protein